MEAAATQANRGSAASPAGSGNTRGPDADPPSPVSIDVLGVGIAGVGQAAAVEQIITLARRRRGAYVCLANVHMCMEAHDDPGYRDVVNGAALVLADGRPVYWWARLAGGQTVGQVRGIDLTRALLGRCAADGLRVGFYGSTEHTLRQLRDVALEMGITTEQLVLVSPPFGEFGDEAIEADCTALEDANLDVLFVGLGCPRQERWMAKAVRHFNGPMLGVGAAFDFLSGTRREAPRGWQRLGLEWLFRLGHEPGRLWKRYLIHNPRFMVHAARRAIKGPARP